jgi:alkylation response protein AidB-like acyl-CoA dehydrogenase
VSGAEVATGEEATFRDAVVTFLDATVPRKGTGARPTGEAVERARAFQAGLAGAGLAGVTWPPEYGGLGLPGRFQRIFEREAAAYELPPRVLEIGLGMVGPTILVHGSDEQKRALIPPLLRGEHVWCELFSEPGAGSDLASVQTRARRDGDEWVVDGQKVWTSGAQHSDLAACLARTDPDRPKHEGLTMLVVDMHGPGVTVAPLRQMTGDAQFNQVFLDAVRVPLGSTVGDVDRGWRVARTMLGFERQALSGLGSSGGRGSLSAIAAEATARGLISHAVVRQRIVDLRARQMLLRHLTAYLEARRRAGGGSGGEAAILKLAMARLVQDAADAAVDIAGPGAVAWDAAERGAGRWSAQLLNAPSASIGGGTNEIVRNVIAERVLGLPRDVEVDAGVPFRDLRVGTQRHG